MTPETPFLLKLVLALAIGGVIGIEREHSIRQSPLGVRSFALLAVLGFLVAELSAADLGFLALGLFGAFALAALYYYFKTKELHQVGVTTAVLIPFAFLLGALVGAGQIVEAGATALLVTFLVVEKRRVHALVGKLSTQELVDALAFAILAFILYPLAPAEPVQLFGVAVSLQYLALVIVLVSLITFTAHLFNKYVREKGAVYASFFGGLVSSLAYLYYANKRLHQTDAKTLNVHYLLGTGGELTRNLLLLALLAPALATAAIPLAVLLLAALFLARRALDSGAAQRLRAVDRSLSLLFAVQFALLFTVINVVTQHAAAYGPTGILAASFFGGLISTASVFASIAQLYAQHGLTAGTATAALLAAVFAALVAKLGYLFSVTRRSDWRVFVRDALLITLPTLVAYLLFAA